jgi:hypothetical protein
MNKPVGKQRQARAHKTKQDMENNGKLLDPNPQQ